MHYVIMVEKNFFCAIAACAAFSIYIMSETVGNLTWNTECQNLDNK